MDELVKIHLEIRFKAENGRVTCFGHTHTGNVCQQKKLQRLSLHGECHRCTAAAQKDAVPGMMTPQLYAEELGKRIVEKFNSEP